MTEYTEPFYIAHPSDETAVIFNYQTLKGRFDLGHYFPEMTNHQLQIDDLQKFFQKIELYLKPWRDSVISFSMLICLFCLIIVIGLLIIPWVLAMTGNTKITLYIIAPLVLGLSSRVLWMSFKHDWNAKFRLEEAKQNIETYIITQQEFLQSKGLRCSLPRQFPEWIELWKEYQCPDPEKNITCRVQFVEMV